VKAGLVKKAKFQKKESKMSRLEELLKGLVIGNSNAEDESTELSKYFLETSQWRTILEDRADFILGPKGSGKSALFTQLVEIGPTLELEQRILLIPVEKPRGNPAFELLGRVGLGEKVNGLIVDEKNLERKLMGIWNLYFLLLTTKELQIRFPNEKNLQRLFRIVEDEKLLPEKVELEEYLALVVDVANKAFVNEALLGKRNQTIIGGLLEGLKWTIDFKRQANDKKNEYYVSIDELLREINATLEEMNLKVWFAIDRLDAAFAEDIQLEQVALRSLVRVRRDFGNLQNFGFKIFFRDDIWDLITYERFPELSHIMEKTEDIKWKKRNLLNMVIRRFAADSDLLREFSTTKEEIFSDYVNQQLIFHHILPGKMVEGGKEVATIDWIWDNLIDAKNRLTPREVIQLLQYGRKAEMDRIHMGERGEEPIFPLISSDALREVLIDVSERKLKGAIFGVQAGLRDPIERLFGWKTEFSLDELAEKLELEKEETKPFIKLMKRLGFLGELKGRSNQYFIGPIYLHKLQE